MNSPSLLDQLLALDQEALGDLMVGFAHHLSPQRRVAIVQAMKQTPYAGPAEGDLLWVA